MKNDRRGSWNRPRKRATTRERRFQVVQSTGIRLDGAQGTALYRQLFDQVADRIRSGPWPKGHRLPPHLARMQPSPDLLPSDLFRRCIEHILATQGPKALGYAPRDGLPRLRGLIAVDLQRQGIPARAEDVLVTTGSQQALDLMARAFVN